MAARRTLRAVDGSACTHAACGGPSTALLGDLGDLGVDWSTARATAHVLAITNATELRCSPRRITNARLHNPRAGPGFADVSCFLCGLRL
jgi:hypothetical protein